MKTRITLIALFAVLFSYGQIAEGRWVNTSFAGDENLAYEFLEGNILKMYYAGSMIPTEKPVKYTLTKKGDDYWIEMSYVNKLSEYNANVLGLIRLLGKDRMEMEFWAKGSLPEKIEFTDESLIYQLQ